MTITTISDIHGRNIWERVPIDLNTKLEQRLVFLGDYFDNFHYSDQKIMDNFLKILELKDRYPEQVILLLANHELHYLFEEYKHEGYRESMSGEINKILYDRVKIGDIQYAYQYKDHIWTHAGITNTWLNDFSNLYNKLYAKRYQSFESVVISMNLTEVLNHIFLSSLEDIIGDEKVLVGKLFNNSSPLFIRLKESVVDYLRNYHQIVGHSPVKFIATMGKDKESITYTDCHRDRGDFLIKSF